MAFDLDITGNFRAGQRATLERRRGRQQERAIDYELAKEEEDYLGRRDSMAYQNELYGIEDFDFGDFQTNKDPLFQRLGSWWQNRKQNAVTPTSTADQKQNEFTRREQAAERAMQYGSMQNHAADGGMAIGYRHGGRVGEVHGAAPLAAHAPRRRSAIASAGTVPQYADGGQTGVGRLDELDRQQQRIERGRAAEAARAKPPTRTRGAINRAGNLARRGANAAGRIAAVPALAATGIQTAGTGTEQYRERFGMGPSEREGIPRLIEDVGVRTLGAASDLGNALTLGYAGEHYRDLQEEPEAAAPAEAIPTTPEEVLSPDQQVAEDSIQEGAVMAEEAAEANKPPGAIDTSKVDFGAGDIPNMPVKDWVEYRGREVRNLMAQGRSSGEAHAEVTALQQQGFVDYSQQALMHLQGGNAPAAATAMRMAYQYFPNGSDIQLGVYQDEETGQPSLIGRGFNEESGEPQGNPMMLNSDRLSVMIENFSNPEAFRTWTKDWRDEAFQEKEFQLDQQIAESDAQYKRDVGQSYIDRARADLLDAQGAGAGGRDQTDLDRANAAFLRESEMLAVGDPERADNVRAAMAAIYARAPDWQYPEVIDFINDADRAGNLDQVLAELGIQ